MRSSRTRLASMAAPCASSPPPRDEARMTVRGIPSASMRRRAPLLIAAALLPGCGVHIAFGHMQVACAHVALFSHYDLITSIHVNSLLEMHGIESGSSGRSGACELAADEVHAACALRISKPMRAPEATPSSLRMVS